MKSSVRSLILLVLAWGLVAALVIASGVPRSAPPGVVPALVFVAAVVLVVALVRRPALRDAVAAVPTRAFVAVNVLRVVGAAFLVYAVHGRVPAVFADRAGWGDVATGIGALALVLAGRRGMGPRALWVWNTFGTSDLFIAVGTAAWLTVTQPPAMVELARFPLALIPFWGVPMFLAIHAVIFRRLRAAPEPNGGGFAVAARVP